jgi:hypothetical protein
MALVLSHAFLLSARSVGGRRSRRITQVSDA